MLSEKITSLFELLSCTNAEIAHYADCDRSYISHIRRGSRNPSPSSRAIARIVEGVYRYADHENMLSVLCELCRTDSDSREVLLPALVAWLFDAEETELPQIAKIPKKKSRKEAKAAETHDFGEKLDAVMQLLELSNARLARSLNVDNSLVSRFRCGVRSPLGNEQMAGEIVAILLDRAVEQNRLAGLSRLCGISENLLGDEREGRGLFSRWLYKSDSEDDTSVIDSLLESIDSFSPSAPPFLPEYVPAEGLPERATYWGTEGLRAAVIRFLSEAAENGGTLWLYSDEDMRWMFGDKAFFGKWASLMLACIKKMVKIKIIHNTDRGIEEMLNAIRGWMPLYMSGLIEPYVSRRPRDARFMRTFFLNPGRACIHASFTAAAGDDKWYDYITDERKLEVLAADYQRLLETAESLLKIYLDAESWRLYRNYPLTGSGAKKILLSSLSLATIPEALLKRMLERQVADEEVRQGILKTYRARRGQFKEALKEGHVYEFVTIPSDDALFAGKVTLNLGTELLEEEISYTAEEFAEHAQAVIRLISQQKRYHFCILPELPFPDIQIVYEEDESVAIIRCKSPYAGFVFAEPLLCHAVGVYFDILEKKYGVERSAVRQKLKRYY